MLEYCFSSPQKEKLMKATLNLLGILLIIFGIITLGYQGFTYTKKEKIAEIGDVQISANQEKTIYFPPIVGGISLVVGVIIVLMGKRNG